MAIANDIRKTLTDPTPLYFAAGVIDKIREEAPDRIAAVRETDPKELQAKVSQQAKETQAKVTEQAKETQTRVSEVLGSLDTDIKKLREQTQHYALQGVGLVAEYAVKARETYDELAERGRGAVQTWRGEGESGSTQVTVEREPVKVAEPPAGKPQGSAAGTGTKSGPEARTDKAGTKTEAETKTEPKPGPAAKKSTATSGTTSTSGSTARKTTTAKKTTPKSDS